jgi:hypothetical protein
MRVSEQWSKNEMNDQRTRTMDERRRQEEEDETIGEIRENEREAETTSRD